MICLLPTSPRKIRNDGEAVTSPPLLNPTTCIESGESMVEGNTSKLSLEEQATKVCTKCGEEKSVAEFYKKKSGKLGRTQRCKVCRKKLDRARYEANKDKILKKQKQYNTANAESISKNKRRYRQANKERLLAKDRRYYKDNREKVLAKNLRRHTQRIKQDAAYKIGYYLRSRQRYAIRGRQKIGSAVRDIGCSGEQLKAHIESLFDENMTWENAGTYWHLDHIFPLAAANLEDRAEFLAVSNWRNLQPLEAKANLAKKDKVTPAARRLFNKLVKEFS